MVGCEGRSNVSDISLMRIFDRVLRLGHDLTKPF